MSSHSWKSQFSQPISGYNAMEAQGLSELGFALQSGQISQEDYLKWARENFELMSIDVKFFHSKPAQQKLFEKVKDLYPWGPECLPIAEWENCLLIAGLEKPADLPAEIHPIFLIAPVEGLLNYWNHYQSETSAESSSEEGSGEVEVESFGLPDGMNVEASAPVASAKTSVSLDFSGISLAAAPQPATETATTPASVAKQANADVISISISGDEVKAQAPMAGQQPLQPKVPPPTTEIKLSEETLLVPQEHQEVLENTVPEIKAQPQVVPAAPAAAAMQATPNPLPDKELQKAFAECKKHYEKLVYVDFQIATQLAQAQRWPPDFVAAQQPSHLSLADDSFLSIVFKTQKTYHGYLSPNGTTKKFFEELNSGHIPENVTAIPVVQNDTVVGAIVGWGPKSTYSLTVLRDMEKIVTNMLVGLGWISAEAA